MDNLRLLERNNDPRWWIAKSRIRWPKKLGPSRIEIRQRRMSQLVSALKSVWECWHKDQDPPDEVISHWVEWAIKRLQWTLGDSVEVLLLGRSVIWSV